MAAISRLRRWDFLCLQEVAREGAEVHRRLRGGHLLFAAPCSEGAWSGGIVVHADWLRFVLLPVRAPMLLGGLVFEDLRGGEEVGHRERATSLPDQAYDEAIGDSGLATTHGRRVAQMWGVDAGAGLHTGLGAEPTIGRRIPPPRSSALFEREISLGQPWHSCGMEALDMLSL